MVNFFGKGEIVKGSDCDILIFLFPCYVDTSTVQDLNCLFYTASGVSIEKTQEDFTFSGSSAAVHMRAGELDTLEDGVLRYTANYVYGEDQSAMTVERASNYYLKTPVEYTPAEFVTKDELDSAVASAMTSSAVTEEIQEVVEDIISGVSGDIQELSASTVNIESGLSALSAYTESIVVPDMSGYTTTAVTAELSAATSGIAVNVETLSAATSGMAVDLQTLSGVTSGISSDLQTLQTSAVTSTSIHIIWTGSQAQYDAITTKDPNTLYIVQ